jgi:hypothetical protein
MCAALSFLWVSLALRELNVCLYRKFILINVEKDLGESPCHRSEAVGRTTLKRHLRMFSLSASRMILAKQPYFFFHPLFWINSSHNSGIQSLRCHPFPILKCVCVLLYSLISKVNTEDNRMASVWFHFVGLGQGGVLLVKPKKYWWTGTTNWRQFCRSSSWFLKKKCSICVFQAS